MGAAVGGVLSVGGEIIVEKGAKINQNGTNASKKCPFQLVAILFHYFLVVVNLHVN